MHAKGYLTILMREGVIPTARNVSAAAGMLKSRRLAPPGQACHTRREVVHCDSGVIEPVNENDLINFKP